jgi:pimeloyl-ACP methyl ester carboxylesterase
MNRHPLPEVFDAVCRAHPIRTFLHHGVAWRYRAAGDGAQGLLLLPGAVGNGEAYFLLLPAVAASHRALAISYPPVGRLNDVLDGLHALALHEGITSVDIVGGSFGGLLAQAFLQRYPSFTRRVVLSATRACQAGARGVERQVGWCCGAPAGSGDKGAATGDCPRVAEQGVGQPRVLARVLLRGDRADVEGRPS